MTPKEKAQELVNRMTRPTPKNEDFNLYDDYYNDFNNYGKQCALIAVEEILQSGPTKIVWEDDNTEIPIMDEEWWESVKKEIEAL